MANNSEQDTLRSDPVVGALQAAGRGLKFVEAFIREPFTVGSFWPSSAALSRALVNGCEFHVDDTVVELGPGTGNFTELLLERLKGRGRMVALELSSTNISVLRKRFAPCEIIHDSAENMGRHFDALKIEAVDYFVSGIPFVMLSESLSKRIIAPCRSWLRTGGRFIQFHYSPLRLGFYRRSFGNVRVKFIPLNIPPALVISCQKNPATVPLPSQRQCP